MKAAVLSLLLALPAQAEVQGTVEASTGRIDFYTEQGMCRRDARRAEFVPLQGAAVPGCWVMSPDAAQVFVVFFDGDIAKLDRRAIKPPKEV